MDLLSYIKWQSETSEQPQGEEWLDELWALGAAGKVLLAEMKTQIAAWSCLSEGY